MDRFLLALFAWALTILTAFLYTLLVPDGRGEPPHN